MRFSFIKTYPTWRTSAWTGVYCRMSTMYDFYLNVHKGLVYFDQRPGSTLKQFMDEVVYKYL